MSRSLTNVVPAPVAVICTPNSVLLTSEKSHVESQRSPADPKEYTVGVVVRAWVFWSPTGIPFFRSCRTIEEELDVYA